MHTSATESTHAQISGTVTNAGSLYQEAAQASEGSSSCKYGINGSPLLGFSFSRPTLSPILESMHVLLDLVRVIKFCPLLLM